MKEFQKRCDEFAHRFDPPYWTPHENMTQLMEEVGELGREINIAYGPKDRKSEEQIKNIEMEMGDIVKTLAFIANSLDIDLEKAMNASIEKSFERDGERYKRAQE